MSKLVLKQLDEVTENEWFSLHFLEGLTLLDKKDNQYYEDRIMEGWTCVTPTLKNEGRSIWIKPEDWGKVQISFKNYQTENLKEIALNQWIKAMKEQGYLSDIQTFHKVKGNKSLPLVWFEKKWTIDLLGSTSIQKTKFSVRVPFKNIERWAYDFKNTGVLNTDEFSAFIDFENKWEILSKEWEKEIFTKWKCFVEPLNEAQRSPWYAWIKKVWTEVNWNEEYPLASMTKSFTDFISDYEHKKHKQERQAALINTEKLINFDRFEEHFTIARSKTRDWTFFMGPPNTGKTYRSFEKLSHAKNGAYWGPLRLLALEGHEALLDRGVLNDLITGEERRYSLGSTHVSSTVEMANLHKPLDVAVLDEVQLLIDPERGWAWTQAVLGGPTDELVLTGSHAAIPYVERMVNYLGDNLEIVKLESDRVLRRDKSICGDWKRVREGDALIAFSRKDVLAWKEAAEKRGWKVSVIYGHLSPEVRQEEARKFREKETQILVSTDAIGLGLNLPIQRIIFTTISKYDGNIERLLKSSEAWQIANRAGRKGWSEEGGVTTWFESDEVMLWHLLDTQDEPPRDLKWWVQPLPSQVELWNRKMGSSLPQLLSVFTERMLKNHPIFKPCPMTDAIERAYKLDKMKLHITDQYAYATAPVDANNFEGEALLLEWALRHSEGKKITWSHVRDNWIEKEHYHNRAEALLDAESKLKMLTVYRWLTLKFPDIYSGTEEAQMEHERLNTMVERALSDIVRKREQDGKGAGTLRMKKSRYN